MALFTPSTTHCSTTPSNGRGGHETHRPRQSGAKQHKHALTWVVCGSPLVFAGGLNGVSGHKVSRSRTERNVELKFDLSEIHGMGRVTKHLVIDGTDLHLAAKI